jgi:hypothetical protein
MNAAIAFPPPPNVPDTGDLSKNKAKTQELHPSKGVFSWFVPAFGAHAGLGQRPTPHAV